MQPPKKHENNVFILHITPRSSCAVSCDNLFANFSFMMAVDKLHVHVPLNTVSANDEEGNRHITIDIDDFNKADDTINERYDRSILNDIDPDINFLLSGLKSLNYSKKKPFLDKYKNNTNFSILTSNVRSIPKTLRT